MFTSVCGRLCGTVLAAALTVGVEAGAQAATVDLTRVNLTSFDRIDLAGAQQARDDFLASHTVKNLRSETFEGKVYGYVVWPPRGGNGFGYDPMFVANGQSQTFGEMEPASKYAISHRTRAFDHFKHAVLDVAG